MLWFLCQRELEPRRHREGENWGAGLKDRVSVRKRWTQAPSTDSYVFVYMYVYEYWGSKMTET